MEHLPSSIKGLKDLITKAGLSFQDCFEKADLRARALEATKRLEEAENLKTTTTAPEQGNRTKTGATSASGSGPSKSRFSVYDSLVLHTSNDAARRDAIVIILHGYGATNNDFVPLSQYFKRHPSLESKNITCIFPQAPMSRDGMPAWWEIDVMKWMGAMAGGEATIAKLIRDTPEGLVECRQNLIQLVKDVKDTYGSDIPLILGGFSQGAMTSMDLALSLPEDLKTNLQSVLMLSGAPIVVEEWAQKLPQKKLKVFVSHGTSDNVLPFMASSWLKQLLDQGGADVRHEIHGGGHELGPQHVIDSLCNFVSDSLVAEF